VVDNIYDGSKTRFTGKNSWLSSKHIEKKRGRCFDTGYRSAGYPEYTYTTWSPITQSRGISFNASPIAYRTKRKVGEENPVLFLSHPEYLLLRLFEPLEQGDCLLARINQGVGLSKPSAMGLMMATLMNCFLLGKGGCGPTRLGKGHACSGAGRTEPIS